MACLILINLHWFIVIITFFSKPLQFFFSLSLFLKQSLQIFPQFHVREVDWSFHNLPYAFLETGPVVSLPSPGTSCILDFPKNIDNNPEIISESPFNSKEAIQLSLENLNSFKVNDTLTIS